jgi:hypothetical protein
VVCWIGRALSQYTDSLITLNNSAVLCAHLHLERKRPQSAWLAMFSEDPFQDYHTRARKRTRSFEDLLGGSSNVGSSTPLSAVRPMTPHGAGTDEEEDTFRARRMRLGLIESSPPHSVSGPMDAWVVALDTQLAGEVGKCVVVVMDVFSSYIVHLAAPSRWNAGGPAAIADNVFREALSEASKSFEGIRHGGGRITPQCCYFSRTEAVDAFFKWLSGGAGSLAEAQLTPERLLCRRSGWNVRAPVPLRSGPSGRKTGTPTHWFFSEPASSPCSDRSDVAHACSWVFDSAHSTWSRVAEASTPALAPACSSSSSAFARTEALTTVSTNSSFVALSSASMHDDDHHMG